MKIGLLNCGGTITENYQADGTIKRLSARDLIALSGQPDWIGRDIDECRYSPEQPINRGGGQAG